uniref:5-hydroxytryptamine (serotonin) receptor 2C, G protein-coupled-like 2 n=1 Tax=Sinocyclocheilus anshuiensis TaxID=1608454 RepID=A0A671NLH1_9TELE
RLGLRKTHFLLFPAILYLISFVTLPWNVSLDLNHSYFKSNLPELEDTQPTVKNWPALFILAFIFFTVAGNILVIMAVSIERKLHNATNYFLCSLAVADMLVGFLVMPASLISILYNHTWPLPELLCPLWIFLDVLFSTASIMHLFGKKKNMEVNGYR